MTDQTPEQPGSGSQIVLYQTEDGRRRIQVRIEGETVWLPQSLMAEFFQTTPQNITIHIKSIYHDGELDETATCKDYLQVQQEGGRTVRRQVKFYNFQYDAFAERRRLEAEAAAQTRYLDDLRTSAKMLEAEREKPLSTKKERVKRRRKNGEQDSHPGDDR
jgi:hypothetical protein